MGSTDRVPLILNLDNRWRLVVNFMLILLHPPGRGPQYPMNRNVGCYKASLDILEQKQNIYKLL